MSEREKTKRVEKRNKVCRKEGDWRIKWECSGRVRGREIEKKWGEGEEWR